LQVDDGIPFADRLEATIPESIPERRSLDDVDRRYVALAPVWIDRARDAYNRRLTMLLFQITNLVRLSK